MGRQSNLTVEQRTEAVLSLLRREEPAARVLHFSGRKRSSPYFEK